MIEVGVDVTRRRGGSLRFNGTPGRIERLNGWQRSLDGGRVGIGRVDEGIWGLIGMDRFVDELLLTWLTPEIRRALSGRSTREGSGLLIIAHIVRDGDFYPTRIGLLG